MSATDQATADDATVRGEATEEEQRATAAARKGTELAQADDFTLPARHKWDGSQVAVIRKTVAKDCNPNELAMFLEVAARYQLDPFTREIFAAKFNGENGPVTIFAGRDGLLKAAKIAKGSKLRHMESHVVREMDEYEVIVDTETITDEGVAKIRKLRHVRKGMGTGTKQEDGTYKGGRGPIIGAYALVWMQGEEAPWFAEATWEDYGEKKASGDKKSNWKTDGSGYTEAMMIKVPQSIALRMACGLAGLYSQEEVQKQLDERPHQNLSGGGAGSSDPTATTPGIDWPEGELGMTLQVLTERCNELVPNSWRQAKIAMNVNGKSEEQLQELAAKLRQFIGQRAPSDPLAQEPEVIQDAVLVDDDETPGPDEPGSAPGQADPENEPEPAEDRLTQGPMSDAILAAAHDNEDARVLIQERLTDLLRDDLEPADLGFPSEDDVLAEADRLESALRDATNGGETVAEAVDAEVVNPDDVQEPIEWGPEAEAELAELEQVLPELKDEVEKAAEGSEEHRVLLANYTEALERWEALQDARKDAGE